MSVVDHTFLILLSTQLTLIFAPPVIDWLNQRREQEFRARQRDADSKRYNVEEGPYR